MIGLIVEGKLLSSSKSTVTFSLNGSYYRDQLSCAHQLQHPQPLLLYLDAERSVLTQLYLFSLLIRDSERVVPSFIIKSFVITQGWECMDRGMSGASTRSPTRYAFHWNSWLSTLISLFYYLRLLFNGAGAAPFENTINMARRSPDTFSGDQPSPRLIENISHSFDKTRGGCSLLAMLNTFAHDQWFEEGPSPFVVLNSFASAQRGKEGMPLIVLKPLDTLLTRQRDAPLLAMSIMCFDTAQPSSTALEVFFF